MKCITSLMLICFFAITAVAQSQIPDTWLPGMTLTTWHGAGMRNQSDSLRISDSISFERHSGQNNKKYAFNFTRQELNDLLHYLKAKNFDKIKSVGPQLVYDGWSSNIVLQWNEGHIIIETGSSYTIPEQYRNDLSEIEQYITGMVERKKKQRR